jgi:hypothetical protein
VGSVVRGNGEQRVSHNKLNREERSREEIDVNRLKITLTRGSHMLVVERVEGGI